MHNGDWIASPRSKREIEQVAESWRYYFDFENHWILNLLGVLEHDLPRLAPEFCCRVVDNDALGDALAVTTFSPFEITFRESVYNGLVKDQGYARFTAAHELGHALLHSTDRNLHRMATQVQSRIDNRSISAEWQADVFAAGFLMPERLVRMFSTPDDLADGCKVSLSAAQRRMTELRLWPKVRIPPSTEFLDKFRPK